MTGTQWELVKRLFHQAVDRTAGERQVWLNEACEGDSEVRREVEALLAADRCAQGFLDSAGDGYQGPPPPHLTGRVLGHYELGRLLGAGGMGAVYVAHDFDLDRDVAIKVVTDPDPAAQARLRREAQHASLLNHPNICTIHQDGTCQPVGRTGRPAAKNGAVTARAP